MSYLSEEELDEFIVESEELLDQAEECLLRIDQGSPLSDEYAAVFRVYHSLKGAAGMVDLDHLQKYMHIVESMFESKKGGSLDKNELTFYLNSVDDARLILRGDNSVALPDENLATPASNEQPKQEQAPEPQSPTKAPIAATLSPTVKTTSDSERDLVIFVDDEEELLDLYLAMFSTSDYDVQAFISPSEALASFKIKTPTLIVSDLKMPDIDGIQFLTRVRELDEDLPFILCSGFLDSDITSKAHELNLYAAIDKPFDENKLDFLIKNGITHNKTKKLISKMIHFLMRQFNTLETCLKGAGKEADIEELREDLRYLLQQKRLLKSNQSRFQA